MVLYICVAMLRVTVVLAVGTGVAGSDPSGARSALFGIRVPSEDTVTVTTSPQPGEFTLWNEHELISADPKSLAVIAGAMAAMHHLDAAPVVDRIDTHASLLTSIGELELESLVASTSSSTIFSASGFEEPVIVKFHTDCFSLDDEVDRLIHPLAREYWFMKAIEPLGIAPRALTLSKPVAMPEAAATCSARIAFNLKSDRWALCHARGAQIRYLTTTHGGTSLSEISKTFPLRKLPLVRAMDIGIELIRILQKLHAVGVVHGDIHGGNVCEREGKLSLIDFGKALFVSQHGYSKDNMYGSFTFNHAYLSPWEMLGFRPSFRDDVYRALLLVSFLVNGEPLLHRVIKRNAHVFELFNAKFGQNVFYLLGEDNFAGSGVAADKVVEIRLCLSNVAKAVMQLHDSIDAQPDYVLIIEELTKVREILSH